MNRKDPDAATSQHFDMKPGLLAAVLSNDDPSTPFWVGEIIAGMGGAKEKKSTSLFVRVRWYQASGAASDPFDAAYAPAFRATNGTETQFWESSIRSSEVILTFDGLTEEKRLKKESIAEIKRTLYR